MSNGFEEGGFTRPSRVEYVRNPDDSFFVDIPPEITEEWLEDLTEEFGNEEFVVTLKAEDWLVQRPEEDGAVPLGSSYYVLEDEIGPNAPYTVNGRLWDAGMTATPQYVEGWESPVLALLDAKVSMGRKEKPIPSDPKHLVLVRLDRVPTGITLTKAA